MKRTVHMIKYGDLKKFPIASRQYQQIENASQNARPGLTGQKSGVLQKKPGSFPNPQGAVQRTFRSAEYQLNINAFQKKNYFRLCIPDGNRASSILLMAGSSMAGALYSLLSAIFWMVYLESSNRSWANVSPPLAVF